MLKKKTTFLVLLAFLITSCADSWDSVKRGLTGSKQRSTDEFLVKKKDPLILPPDFDSLPSPAEKSEAMEEMISLERAIQETTSAEITPSSESSTEQSILKQIRKK